MRKIKLPSDAIIVALTEVGLRHARRVVRGITEHRNFSVFGVYLRGERWGTSVCVYDRHSRATIMEHADQIERRTRELGYAFRVTTRNIALPERGYVTTIVDISNV